MFISLAIFLVCCVFIAYEKVNKIVVALVGAIIFILIGYVDIIEAFSEFIDWNVIFLLIGIMLMVGVLKKTGIFEYLAIYLSKKAKGNPKYIIIFLFFVTGILSAFVDNVTTMVIITPITILIAVELGISPLPFIITQLIGSSIAGTATLIGDPPNLLVGSAAGFSFMDFLNNLGLFVLLNMVICGAVLYLFFRKDLVVSNERRARIMEFREKELIHDKGLLIHTGIVLFIFILLFVFQEQLGLAASTIALIAAILSIIKVKKNELEHFVSQEVEWGSILFFVGLFTMVGALQTTGFISFMSRELLALSNDNIQVASVILIWTSGLASSFVDNVPFVAATIPMIHEIADKIGPQAVTPLWWSLVLGASFGGNGTLIASYSNLITADIARRSNYPISFWTFSKYGIIITLINLVLSSAFIIWRYF
jgi:Na+/H+ antiporter NhaD/arsenite permease-like protein